MKTLFRIRQIVPLLLVPVAVSLAAVKPTPADLANPVHRKAVLDDTRTFNVSNFDRLDLGSAFVINVKQGSGFKVTATGRSEDLDDLEASANGGQLVVKFRNRSGWNQRRERVTINVTMPSLRGISFSGASKSTVTGFHNTKSLDIDISGASSSEIDVDAERVTIDFSGASNITLVGNAKRLDGDVSGATTLKAYDLKVASASVEVSGASNARLNVTDRLEAQASGASSVTYRGSASIRSNTSGASSVRSVD